MTDDALKLVRGVRHHISAEHDHVLEKLVAYYIELQRVYKTASNDN